MSFKIFHIESQRIIYTEFRAFLLLSCYFWELNEKMGVPLVVPLSSHSHFKAIQFPQLLFTDRIELGEIIEIETFCPENLRIPVFRTFFISWKSKLYYFSICNPSYFPDFEDELQATIMILTFFTIGSRESFGTVALIHFDKIHACSSVLTRVR